MQHTLSRTAILSGIGVHSGAETTLKIKKAGLHSGIVFVRTDVGDRDNQIKASWDNVVDTRLCTMIGNASGVTVGTIEHLMAALRACGVDNAIVELDGPEVPIMDGSSAPFIAAIEKAGLKTQAAPRRAIKILKEIVIEDGDKRVVLRPAVGSKFKSTIEFPHPSIGRQSFEIEMLNGQFAHQVSHARTFGFLDEVNALRALGLALGGSLENAIVLDKGHILNPEGLRYIDEFARHKLLDAVGDLYLAGAPIIGQYDGFKAGHGLNNRILHALFAQADAWTFIDLYIDIDAATTQILPPKLLKAQMSAAA
jgi:UDP-3-O-[3-hydroxymyristoyl] N-acetylglucosamine deacetylase